MHLAYLVIIPLFTVFMEDIQLLVREGYLKVKVSAPRRSAVVIWWEDWALGVCVCQWVGNPLSSSKATGYVYATQGILVAYIGGHPSIAIDCALLDDS